MSTFVVASVQDTIKEITPFLKKAGRDISLHDIARENKLIGNELFSLLKWYGGDESKIWEEIDNNGSLKRRFNNIISSPQELPIDTPDMRSDLAKLFEDVRAIVGKNPDSFFLEDYFYNEHAELFLAMVRKIGRYDDAANTPEELFADYYSIEEGILRLLFGVDPITGVKDGRGRPRVIDPVELSKELSSKGACRFTLTFFKQNVSEKADSKYMSLYRILNLRGFWEEFFSEKGTPIRQYSKDLWDDDSDLETIFSHISPAYRQTSEKVRFRSLTYTGYLRSEGIR